VALIGPKEPQQKSTHQGVFASHYDTSRLTRVIDPNLVWGTLAKRSIARYRDIERQSSIEFFHNIGYMMVTPGGLGADWFDLPAMREVATDLNVEIEDLDDDLLKQRFPFLNFTPGSSAVLQEKDAGYFNPRLLVEAQQTIAIAQGTTLLREEVVQIQATGEQVKITTGSGGTVRANRVLVATGAYANATKLLANKLNTTIRAAMIMVSEVAPQQQVAYPSTLYAKTDGEEDFWGLLMPPITYPEGRSYIKTMDGYYGSAPLEGYKALGAWSRSNGHEDHHVVLQRALREVFPSLDILSTQFKPCLITDTASHYPYIDMLDDRIGIAVGGNGKGAKSSDEIGRLAAGMIRTQSWPSSLPQAVFTAQFA
jgi:sarcosine oxidase